MLARKSLLLFLVSVTNSVLGFLSTVIIARWMGAESLGVVTYYLGLLGMLSVFLDMGLAFSHLKRVSETRDDPAALIGTFLSLKLGLAIVFVLLTWLLPVVRDRIGRPLFSDSHDQAIYAITAATYVLHSLSSVFLYTYEARMESAKEGLIAFAGSLLSFLAKSLVAIAGLGIVALSAAYLSEPVVLLIGALFLFSGYRIAKPTARKACSYIHYAWPLSLNTAVTLVISNLSPVWIREFWGPSEVGFYASVIGFGALLDRVSATAMMIFFPQASGDVAQGQWQEIHRRLFVIERYMLTIVVPPAVALMVFSHDIVRIAFGSDFQTAAPILACLAAGSVIGTVYQPYATVLYAIEKQKHLLNASLVGLAAMLLTNTLLIPRQLGALALPGLAGLGAAIGLIAMALARGIYQQIMVRRQTGIPLYPSLGTYAVAGGAMFGLMTMLNGLAATVTIWLRAPLISVAGLAAYLAILALLRQFTGSDLRVFLGILHPREMARYVATELMGER
jgi:O-antigen/teichoic acid export membrane protein